MAAMPRQGTKTITMASARRRNPSRSRPRGASGPTATDFASRWIGKRKATYEAAQTAGTGIKKHYPTLQVAVYDGVESMNKIIELP